MKSKEQNVPLAILLSRYNAVQLKDFNASTGEKSYSWYCNNVDFIFSTKRHILCHAVVYH